MNLIAHSPLPQNDLHYILYKAKLQVVANVDLQHLPVLREIVHKMVLGCVHKDSLQKLSCEQNKVTLNLHGAVTTQGSAEWWLEAPHQLTAVRILQHSGSIINRKSSQ